MREIGFRANGLSYIPRRYCVARAAMADPPRRRGRPAKACGPWSIPSWPTPGIFGLDWGVEWCVVGLDRSHAYAPDCDVLKPILERWIGEYKPPPIYGLKARYLNGRKSRRAEGLEASGRAGALAPSLTAAGRVGAEPAAAGAARRSTIT